MSSPLSAPTKMPCVFISHGAPLVAIEEGAYQQALHEFAHSCHRRSDSGVNQPV